MRRLMRSACWVFLAWAAFVMTDYPARASADAIPSNDPVFNLPQEPDEFDLREVEAYYDWRNNLFFRLFNLSGVEGKANFMTARRTYKVSVNQYGYEVAVTFANPLFYWLDRNGNGEFEPGQDEMTLGVPPIGEVAPPADDIGNHVIRRIAADVGDQSIGGVPVGGTLESGGQG